MCSKLFKNTHIKQPKMGVTLSGSPHEYILVS